MSALRHSSQRGCAAIYRSRIRFHVRPYRLRVAGSRWCFSYRCASCFSCAGQNLPSVSSGQPGWLHGRLGFLGIQPPPGQSKSPRNNTFRRLLLFDILLCYQYNTSNSKNRPRFWTSYFPYSSMVRRSSARFFFLYADERSIWNRSQILPTASICLPSSLR